RPAPPGGRGEPEGVPFHVPLPVFPTDGLGGDSHPLGLLIAPSGVVALGGALCLAGRTSVRGLGFVILAAVALFGASLIGLGLSRRAGLSMAALLGAGL